MPLQVRRGTEAQRTFIAADGEPLFVTDTRELYVGDGTTTGGLLVKAAYPTLTSASAFLTADFTLTTADTLYDVVSVTLGIGTWLVQVTASLYAVTTSGATQYSVAIQNGTSSAILASAHATHPSQVPTIANASASCVVVLAASTTIKLVAQANAAGRIARHRTYPALGDNATGIVAVRIA